MTHYCISEMRMDRMTHNLERLIALEMIYVRRRLLTSVPHQTVNFNTELHIRVTKVSNKLSAVLRAPQHPQLRGAADLARGRKGVRKKFVISVIILQRALQFYTVSGKKGSQ